MGIWTVQFYQDMKHWNLLILEHLLEDQELILTYHQNQPEDQTLCWIHSMHLRRNNFHYNKLSDTTDIFYGPEEELSVFLPTSFEKSKYLTFNFYRPLNLKF